MIQYTLLLTYPFRVLLAFLCLTESMLRDGMGCYDAPNALIPCVALPAPSRLPKHLMCSCLHEPAPLTEACARAATCRQYMIANNVTMPQCPLLCYPHPRNNVCATMPTMEVLAWIVDELWHPTRAMARAMMLPERYLFTVGRNIIVRSGRTIPNCATCFDELSSPLGVSGSLAIGLIQFYVWYHALIMFVLILRFTRSRVLRAQGRALERLRERRAHLAAIQRTDPLLRTLGPSHCTSDYARTVTAFLATYAHKHRYEWNDSIGRLPPELVGMILGHYAELEVARLTDAEAMSHCWLSRTSSVLAFLTRIRDDEAIADGRLSLARLHNACVMEI